MSYEIPKELKYEEKIIFNLTIWQSLWLGFFSIIAAIIFLRTPLEFEIKIVAGIFLLIAGAGFAFLDLKSHLLSLFAFVSRPMEIGYLDKKMAQFLDVKNIADDVVYLKNGHAKAIVHVQPINFHILSARQQQAIIGAFKDFLNSLDFPIQIVVRTVNLSLDDYLQSLEMKVRMKKNEKLLVQFNEFQEFVREYIDKNSVKNRLFYIVVPGGANSPFGNKETDLRQLDIRVKLCMDKLQNCKLTTKRLSTNELVSLLSTYFEGFIEVGNEYMSMLTILERRDKNEGIAKNQNQK